MCTEGVCTHGSKDNRTHQNLFSRDSKVSIGADRGRMCNIVNIVNSTPEAAGRLQPHRKGRLQSRPMRPDGWPLEHVSIQICGPRKPRCLEIEKFREPEKKEARAPPRTDLDAGFDRSRRGSGPISRRSTTDLGVRAVRVVGTINARQDQDAAPKAWPLATPAPADHDARPQ